MNTTPPTRCGTLAGWSVHKRRGEKPCDACAAAKRDYDHRWRAAPDRTRRNRLHARAQTKARARLAGLLPELYRVYYQEELTELRRESGLEAP